MKKSNIVLICIALAVVAAILFFTSKQDKEGSGALKIGVILPMTGELASYGEPIIKGMEIAVNEMNKNNTQKFELIISDSKGDPKTAISALQKQISVDNVKYVIGDVSSPVTLALIPIIEKNNVFLLSPGASSPNLGNISPLFARNYPSSIIESIESANFFFKEKGIKETAIIYVNSEYGIGLRDMFKRTYENLGGKIIFSESYDFGLMDFKNVIIKLNQSNAKAIYLGGNQKEMGHFMRQLRESGSNALVVSNISFLESDCLNIAQKAANGVIVPVAYYNPNDTIYKAANKFANFYKETFKEDVSLPIAVGYDAIMLIAKGIKENGNDSRKVAEYIRNLKNYDGALGNLNFYNGDVSMPVEFKIIENMKAVSITKPIKNNVN